MHVEYKKSFFRCRRKWNFSKAYKSRDFLSLMFGLDVFCRLFNSSRIPWCLIWKEQKRKYLRNFASTCQFTNVYVKLFFNNCPQWKIRLIISYTHITLNNIVYFCHYYLVNRHIRQFLRFGKIILENKPKTLKQYLISSLNDEK